MFAAMQRAEERHQQEQAAAGASKRARLLRKLEDGGSGGKAVPPAGTAAGSSSTSRVLTGALREAAARQLAAALSGNAALAAAVGSSSSTGGRQVAAVAAALESQLAAGEPSKPVFLSTLSSLVLQLKKVGAAGDVPVLAEVVSNLGQTGQAGSSSAAAPAAAGANGAVAPPLLAQQLQQQVDDAVRLAEAAGQGLTSSAQAASVAKAVAALQQLEAAPVTADLLQHTGAGKQVQRLRKHQAPGVAATAVVAAWKSRVLAGCKG
jgi:hypothetical protein